MNIAGTNNLHTELGLNFGNPDAGRALPDRIRVRMENALGVGLSGVRVHESSLPARIGADAIAHGTDVYMSPGKYDPDSKAGLKLLAHELAHVGQQLRGDLRGARSDDAPVRVVVCDELEAEADAFADLIASGSVIDQAASRTTPANIDWSVLLPNLWFNDNGTRTKLTSTNNTMTSIENAIRLTPLYFHFCQNRKDIRDILHGWVNSSRHTLKRFLTGRKENIREYQSWENMARALIGEARSAGNLEKETVLAKETETSGYIKWYLNHFISFKLYPVLNRNSRHDKVKIALRSKNPYKGEYSHFYSNMSKVLHDPEKHSFKSKVAVLHDITKVTGAIDRSTYTQVPQNKVLFTAIAPLPNGSWGYQQVNMGTGGFRVNQPAKKFGNNDHCTLLENSEVISAARYNDMPVEMGPSFTCGRMLQTVFGCGGSKNHLTAVAWGIFAFWNLHYSHKYSRVHRFHGTMDMAKNYGVAYTPFVYPKNAPSW